MSGLKLLGLSLAGLVVAAVAYFYYATVSVPSRGQERFCKQWTERLQPIHDPTDIPAEWGDTVYVRRFADGWIAAAMHHGSCSTSGGESCFNASVLRDSTGRITVLPSWSPCAAGIRGMGSFWESSQPAQTLGEFYQKYGSTNERLK